MKDCFSLNPNQKACVSRFYNMDQNISSPSLNHLKYAWEEELGMKIPEEIWRSATERIHKSSFCVRQGGLQFKVFHQLHLCRSTCQRCHATPATTYHMFFSHWSISPFWSSVFETFSNMYSRNIPTYSITDVFGVAPERECPFRIPNQTL